MAYTLVLLPDIRNYNEKKKKEHTNTQIHYISRYFIKCMTFYEFAVIASKHIGWTT